MSNPKDLMGSAKPNLSIIPFAPLFEVCAALTEGKCKYQPWNWRNQKISETIYADAAIRHLIQFVSGEDIDPESGIHHVSKAIAGLVILRDAQIHKTSLDNRAVKQDLQMDFVVDKIKDIHEKYRDDVKVTPPPTGSESSPEYTIKDEPQLPSMQTLMKRLQEREQTIANFQTEQRTPIAAGGSWRIKSKDFNVGDDVLLSDGQHATVTSVDHDDDALPIELECVDADDYEDTIWFDDRGFFDGEEFNQIDGNRNLHIVSTKP